MFVRQYKYSWITPDSAVSKGKQKVVEDDHFNFKNEVTYDLVNFICKTQID